LTDHVQVGLAAVFGTSKAQSQTSNSYSKQTIFGATAYGRYFFGKEAFKPFAGVALSARPIKSKTYNGLVTERSKDFLVSAQINAGFGYAVSKRVTAVGSFGFLGYSHNTHTAPNETTKYKTSSFGMSAGSLGDRFNVGFYYTL